MTLAHPDRPERLGARSPHSEASPSAWARTLERVAVVLPNAPKSHHRGTTAWQREHDARALIAWARHKRSGRVDWIDGQGEALPPAAVVERLAMARAQAVLLSDDGAHPEGLRELLQAIARELPRMWILVAREGGLQGQMPQNIGPYHFLLTGDTGPALQQVLAHLETGHGDPLDISGLTWRDDKDQLRSNPAWHNGATLPAGPNPAWDVPTRGSQATRTLRTSLVCLPDCPTCHGAFGRTLRRRDEDQVVREYADLLRDGASDDAVERVVILDEVFDYLPDRAKRILRGMVQVARAQGREVELHFAHGLRGDRMDLELAGLLRQAGLRAVDLRIESASPRIQQELGRNLDLHALEKGIELLAHQGIRLRGRFGLGFEREDPRERERSIAFARRSALHQVRFEPVGGKRHGNRWSNRLWAGVRFYADPKRTQVWRDWVTERSTTTWQPGLEAFWDRLGGRVSERLSDGLERLRSKSQPDSATSDTNAS